MNELAVDLMGPVGKLQALYQAPDDPVGVVLICHPNPVEGGTLNNKVVSTLQRTARDAGWATLRFNYRGVGGSVGEMTLSADVVDDAAAGLAWLVARHPGLPVLVAGFSFGGWVSLRLAQSPAVADLDLRGLLLVAPAVTREPELAPAVPVWVIQPDADEVLDAQAVYCWVAGLSCPHQLWKVAECSHFFHGHLTALKALAAPIFHKDEA